MGGGLGRSFIFKFLGLIEVERDVEVWKVGFVGILFFGFSCSLVESLGYCGCCVEKLCWVFLGGVLGFSCGACFC